MIRPLVDLAIFVVILVVGAVGSFGLVAWCLLG
jgi:nitrate reductase NapE component